MIDPLFATILDIVHAGKPKSLPRRIIDWHLSGPHPMPTSAEIAEHLRGMADNECEAIDADVLRFAADMLMKSEG